MLSEERERDERSVQKLFALTYEGRSDQNRTDSRSRYINAGGSNGQDQWLVWTKSI